MATESELWADEKADLDDDWHDCFDDLTAQGKSPSGIKATIEYVSSQKSQKEVAREYNVSEVTIRNLQAAVIALGPLDAAVASAKSTGLYSTLDLCAHIADRLGWEEGREYSVSGRNGYSSAHPRLLKAGWISLHQHLVAGPEEADNDG